MPLSFWQADWILRPEFDGHEWHQEGDWPVGQDSTGELSMCGVKDSFTRGRALQTAVATLLLILLLTAGKSPLLLADDQRIHGRRRALEIHQVDGRCQIVEWIGPGAVQLAWPRLEWKHTIISLRVVPTGLPQVGAVAALMPIYGLSLYGVPLGDEDLDFIVGACPELHHLWLRHPSTMSQDEFSDLTDDERAAFATRTLSGEHLARIAELKDLTLLEIAGYASPRHGFNSWRTSSNCGPWICTT